MLFVFIFVPSVMVLAKDSVDWDKMDDQMSAFNENAKFTEADDSDIYVTIAIVINTFLGFLGIIFVILIIYAGFNYMTAAGEEEKVRTAMATIRRAIIGLIIIVSAYGITSLVINAALGNATSSSGGGSSGACGSTSSGYECNF